MTSIRGQIIDRVGQAIDESFGGGVVVKLRRHPFFEFGDQTVVGVFQSGSSVDFEQRGFNIDRTVAVGISVMRRLDPGDEAEQDAQSDALIDIVEQIENLVASEGRVLEFPDGRTAKLISLGDSVSVDDDAVEQEQRFLGELVAEYVT
jgi:hypothetical protein